MLLNLDCHTCREGRRQELPSLPQSVHDGTSRSKRNVNRTLPRSTNCGARQKFERLFLIVVFNNDEWHSGHVLRCPGNLNFVSCGVANARIIYLTMRCGQRVHIKDACDAVHTLTTVHEPSSVLLKFSNHIVLAHIQVTAQARSSSSFGSISSLFF